MTIRAPLYTRRPVVPSQVVDASLNLLAGGPLGMTPGTPTVPIAWPNPVIAAGRGRQYDFFNNIRPLTAAPIPFLPVSWPNPQLRVIGRYDIFQNLLVTTLTQTSDPYCASDNQWPNPTRPVHRQAKDSFNSIPLLTFVSAAPFFQTDWPNPTLRIDSRALRNYSYGLITTTLSLPVGTPLLPMWIDNPVLRRYSTAAFTRVADNVLITAENPNPPGSGSDEYHRKYRRISWR